MVGWRLGLRLLDAPRLYKARMLEPYLESLCAVLLFMGMGDSPSDLGDLNSAWTALWLLRLRFESNVCAIVGEKNR